MIYICCCGAVLPLISIHVTAEDSQRHEGSGALRRVVLLQEARHIQPEVITSRKVVRISIHPPYYLKTTRESAKILGN